MKSILLGWALGLSLLAAPDRRPDLSEADRPRRR